LIDTSIIISILVSSEKVDQAKAVFKSLKDEDLVITFSVLEEIVYVGLSAIYGCRGFKLRDQVRKGLNDQAESFLDSVASFMEDFGIGIMPHPNDPAMLSEAIRAYRLLPADAAIAATCKHNDIRKLATFDADFKRVDFLEVMGLEDATGKSL
jgi:predicted nucleic acid-binding protein